MKKQDIEKELAEIAASGCALFQKIEIDMKKKTIEVTLDFNLPGMSDYTLLNYTETKFAGGIGVLFQEFLRVNRDDAMRARAIGARRQQSF